MSGLLPDPVDLDAAERHADQMDVLIAHDHDQRDQMTVRHTPNVVVETPCTPLDDAVCLGADVIRQLVAELRAVREAHNNAETELARCRDTIARLFATSNAETARAELRAVREAHNNTVTELDDHEWAFRKQTAADSKLIHELRTQLDTARQDALREAADKLEWTPLANARGVARWLRARADQIGAEVNR